MRAWGLPVETQESGFELVDVTPVLARCVGEAAGSGHPHVGTEHVALVAIDGPVGFAEIAARLGLDAHVLRPLLLTCCTERGSLPPGAEPRATPRVVRILAFASQLALIENVHEVRPRHLIRALLGEPGAVAWAGLAAAGLNPVVVRQALTGMRADRQA